MSTCSRFLALIAVFALLPLAAVAENSNRPVAEGEGPERLVFVFQKQSDPRSIQRTADRVAEQLTERLGRPVEVVIPASYSASVQAVVSGRAHVAYMSSIPFLLTREEAPFEILLAEERDGKTDYSSIIVVHRDSEFQTLEDLRGKRMMFTSPTSTSGYVMPYSRLVNEGLLEPREDPRRFFGSVNFAGGYDRALLAVFNRQADVCAVSDYTLLGDKADIYSTPEMREGLRVLTATEGVPTHLVGIRSDLPRELIDATREALLAISEESPELLADVYGAARFVPTEDDEHVKKSVEALNNTGLAARNLTR